MHLRSTLPIVFLIFLSASCKKPGKVEEPKQKKLLTRMTQVSAGTVGNVTVFTDFSYDEQGRIVKEKSPTYEVNYVYKLGELFQAVQQTESSTTTIEFVYEAGKLKKASVDVKGGMPNKFDINYIYQGDKLVRLDRVKDGLLLVKTDYHYNGDVLYKSIGDDYTNIITVEFTTDDKKTIHNDLGKAIIDAMACLRFEESSMHNLLTRKITYAQHGSSLTSFLNVSYEYKYDEEGYPIGLTRKYKHSSQAVATETKFGYEYKML